MAISRPFKKDRLALPLCWKNPRVQSWFLQFPNFNSQTQANQVEKRHPLHWHIIKAVGDKSSSFMNTFRKVLQNTLVSALSASSLQLSGTCCLSVCKLSPFCLEFKIHLKTSLFLTGFFTNLGRPFLWAQVVCTSMWLYVHEWCMVTSTLSFHFAKRFVLYKSYPLLLLLYTQGTAPENRRTLKARVMGLSRPCKGCTSGGVYVP